MGVGVAGSSAMRVLWEAVDVAGKWRGLLENGLTKGLPRVEEGVIMEGGCGILALIFL